MIIGKRHRYIFIEVPNTGSTAIAAELVEHYGGERVLYKHATLGEFLNTPEGRACKDFFVFSAVRHPLDAALTDYFKMKTNHKGRYTSDRLRYTPSVTAKHIELFEYVQNGGDFPGFFRMFQTSAYHNFYILLHHRFDYMMRYERLQADFSEVLRRIGITEVRPLPVVNRTGQKSSNFWDYYTEDIRPRAMRLYWPYMRRWGYEFPPEWGTPRTSVLEEVKFASTHLVGTIVNRTLGIGPNSKVRWASGLREVARQWWS